MVWERSRRAWSDRKSPGGGIPYRDHRKATTAQPTPRGWVFPGLGLAESPPGPRVMGLLWSSSFSSANIPEKQEAAQG